MLRHLVATGELVACGKARATYYEAPTAAPAAGLVEPSVLPRQRVALQLAGEKGFLRRQEYETAAGIPERTAKRDLADLVARGLLRPSGSGKVSGYAVARPA